MKIYKKLMLTIFISAVVLSCPLWATDKSKAPEIRKPQARIKDIAYIQGTNTNQLIGYGLVTGLKGSGDRTRTISNVMLKNMFDNLGIKFDGEEMKRLQTKNTAVVMVTADLPSSFRSGDTIDVTVSSLGDAKSLEYGVLMFATLKGPDGRVYGSAQGPLMVGYEGGGGRGQKETLVGVVPGGAIINRNMDAILVRNGKMVWILQQPDFNTSERIAKAINRKYHAGPAVANGDKFVEIDMDIINEDPVLFAAMVGELTVEPDTRARVVVNERTGTVIMGSDVKVLPVIIAHGDLTLNVAKEQPKPAEGENEEGQQGMNQAEDNVRKERMVQLGGESTVQDVVLMLNNIGATPKDIITILQSLKNAGALQGELVTR